MVELKKIKQGSRTIEKFIQVFQKIVRESEYKERLLIEKFKKGMNSIIR